MSYNDLTDHERKVAEMIASGYTRKEISKSLNVTESSLSWTFIVIKRKLDCLKSTDIARIVTTHHFRTNGK